MDTLTASSVSHRPWVLQFFRNLFGSSRLEPAEEQRPKVDDTKEKDDLGRQLLECPGQPEAEPMLLAKKLGNTKISPSEIHESTIESHNEEPSLLKEMGFDNTTTPAYENKLSDLLNATEMEMEDAAGFAGSIINPLAQHPCEIISPTREEKEESSDGGKLAEGGVSQAACADDGVSMAAGTIAGLKDNSAEEEREHLLKEDIQAEPAKTELSPWNRLLKMYKQRRRLPASKGSHVQGVPAQPLIEDEATMDLVIYGIPAPKAHITLSNPAKPTYAFGLPENDAREMAGDCELVHRDSGSSDAGGLEHPKNVY